MSSLRTHKKFNEAGVIFVWIGVAFLALFSFSVVMIESSRITIAQDQLKQAVNHAALAAALELNGRKSGWRSAKRAAASAFFSQRIEGINPFPQDMSIKFNEDGKSDSIELDPNFKQISTVSGSLKLKVERGVYWSDEDGKFKFRSLEGTQDSAIVDAANQSVQLTNGLPVYALANAVRIEAISQGGFKSFFTESNLGSGSSTVATAITDDELEECVLPLAVPACELMLDTNINSNWSYTTERYEPDIQCQREVLATESDPHSVNNFRSRFEGMMRAELYQAYPKIKDGSGNFVAPNRKAVTLKAVIGVGDERAASDSIASNFEVISVLRNQGTCQKVRIGSRFKPIENGVGSGGLLTNDGSSLANQLRMLFDQAKQDGLTFRKAFTVNNTNPLGTNDPNVLTENYPFLNALSSPSNPNNSELIKDYRLAGGRTLRVKLAQPSHKHNFSNPMCYDFARPANDVEKGVIKGKIMVIAPEKASSATGATNYCDFAARFGQSIGNITPPVASTNPRVVGFVDVTLFDFNVVASASNGTNSFNEVIDTSPSGYEILRTQDVGLVTSNSQDNILTPEEITNSATEFVDASLEYWKCVAKPKCTKWQKRRRDTDNCRLDDCGRPRIPSFKDSFDVLVSQLGNCISSIDEPLWNECKNIGDQINGLHTQRNAIQNFNSIDASDFNDVDELDQSIEDLFKMLNMDRKSGSIKSRMDKIKDLTNEIADLKAQIEELPTADESGDNSSGSDSGSTDNNSTSSDTTGDTSSDTSTDSSSDSTSSSSSSSDPTDTTSDTADPGPSLREQLSNELKDREQELTNKINDLLDRALDDVNQGQIDKAISDSQRSFMEKCGEFTNTSKNLGKVSQPNPYCLPTRRPTCLDTQSDGCYSAIEPKAKQHGCGGIRLRLSCDPQPQMGNTNLTPNPSLVE